MSTETGLTLPLDERIYASYRWDDEYPVIARVWLVSPVGGIQVDITDALGAAELEDLSTQILAAHDYREEALREAAAEDQADEIRRGEDRA